MQIENFIYAAPAAGVVALLYALLTSGWVGRQDAGTERMKNIGDQIARGAMAFLAAEYKVLAIFVLIVAAGLSGLYAATDSGSPLVGVSFVVGALCSALAGFCRVRMEMESTPPAMATSVCPLAI